MSYNIHKKALVDSGFWYALLDEREQHYADAQNKAEVLLSLRYLIPWPTLYETLHTRFTTRHLIMRKFESFLKRPNAEFLDDHPYKDKALELTLAMAGRSKSSPSLVDNVLRMIIEDSNVKVDAVFTFNRRDFTEICARRNIELM